MQESPKPNPSGWNSPLVRRVLGYPRFFGWKGAHPQGAKGWAERTGFLSQLESQVGLDLGQRTKVWVSSLVLGSLVS